MLHTTADKLTLVLEGAHRLPNLCADEHQPITDGDLRPCAPTVISRDLRVVPTNLGHALIEFGVGEVGEGLIGSGSGQGRRQG